MSITTEKLERFVVENQQNLKTIKESLNTFNIFNVLGIQYREIRHSNFLGWLFDPNESHQLGDAFLKGLFKIIRDIEILEPEDYESLLRKDLFDTNVYRETVNNIDILIVNDAYGFVICIENKIHANFSETQLLKYYTYVEENYSEFNNRIYLTLTPKLSNSHLELKSGEYYSNINYQNIISLLKSQKNLINISLPTIKEGINQYITMVENNITKTSKEVALAKEIYRNYKKEIDFIIRNQENFGLYKNEILNCIEKGYIQDIGISHDSGNKDVIFLLPTDEKLRDLFRYPEAKSRGDDFIFSLVLLLEKDVAWLKFGFGNIDDCENKLEIQTIKEKQFKLMKKFDCFKNSELRVDFLDQDGEKNYAAVCSVQLFDGDIYFDTDKTVLELFKERFEYINRMLIQPWKKECLEKLPRH